MSKALTPLTRNDERDISSVAERLIPRAQTSRFPSYFRNFSIFNLFLVFFVNARSTQRPDGEKQEFPLITAIMAIV